MQLNSKIEKSAKELLKLNAAWMPAERDSDQEMLTEEEREIFRKIGLKMHGFLVLGKQKVTLLYCGSPCNSKCTLSSVNRVG